MSNGNPNSQEMTNDQLNEKDPPMDSNVTSGNKFKFFQFRKWEVVLLALSMIMIAFIAVPNYFHALGTLRGEGCSKRLTLLVDCLQYLAEKNGTQPGEKICELFDLNEILTQVQGGGSFMAAQSDLPMFFKIGTEPDCPDPSGNYIISLFLDEDGNVIPPKCSIAMGDKQDYYHQHGIHVALMELVDGDPFITYDNNND